MEHLKEYLPQWIGSNSIAILFLVAAFLKPKLARLLFVLLFTWACWINYSTAHNNPTDYLNYASLSPFDFMRNFINGWFREHVTLMVTFISVGQGLIALGMLLKGWWVRLACIGAIIFLIAITTLGIGSGFPSSVIAAFTAYIILKKDNLDYLWHFRTQISS